MKIFTSHFDYFQDFEIVILYNTNMIKNGSTKFRNRLKELRVGMSLTQSELANKYTNKHIRKLGTRSYRA